MILDVICEARKRKKIKSIECKLIVFWSDLLAINNWKGNKTPAEHRDIFRGTLIAKKNYGEGEVRTDDLLAEKQEKFQAPARARTHDLVSARQTDYPLAHGD